jgi:amino acid adenylation domain-containing protein
MSITEMLADLALQKVQLWIEDNRLRYRAPKGTLSPSLRAVLSEHKNEIIEYLRENENLMQSVYPLSYGQKPLWLLHQVAPTSAAYHVAFTAQICSDVHVPALERALQTLVNRHAMLRTTYEVNDGKPFQRIHPYRDFHFEHVDASTWSQSELHRQVRKAYQRPFDLACGPVLRANLFTQSAQNHVLLLTSHHIATDGWSLWILLDELRVLYSAERSGTQIALPALSLQYTDYISWQNSTLAGPEGERLWAYWKRQLADAFPALRLPTDKPRPLVQTYHGASHPFQLNESLTRRLKELARAQGVTLYVLLLAVFQSLLHRYSNQEDVIVGSPTFGRERAEFAGIVGDFINLLALRANFSGNPTFVELLRQVHRTFLDAMMHQEYPISLLIERLQPVRTPGYSPLFQVMFVLQRPHRSEELGEFFVPVETETPADFGGLTLKPFFMPQQEGQFDLTLNMGEVKGCLFGILNYNTDLFEAATIDRLVRHFRTLLESIIVDPEQRIQNLPLLTEAEQYQLQITWNNTRKEYPEDASIHRLFESQVERTPDAVAVVFEDEQLTYEALNDHANRLAHTLQAAGVGPEVLVGISMERSLEMLVGLFGILKAGGAYVPLDPTYPRERLAFMIENARLSLLLTNQRLLPILPPHQVPVLDLERAWPMLTHERVTNPSSGTRPQNLAYVIYTSGSTGRPKGAMNTHAGIGNRLIWMQETYQLTGGDVVLQKTPLSFDVSVWECFWPLLAGARLVLARPEGHKDPAYLVDLIAEQQISTAHFVPSMLQIFLLQRNLEQCSSLKRVICSGESLPIELQELFFSRLEAHLFNLYGPTEASIDVTCWHCQQGNQKGTVPIGRPIANTQIYLLDRSLRPVPVGLPGELYIGGVGVARGYLAHPALTAERFIPDPLGQTPGTRLYRTGDLARYLPDGNIEFLGRIDYQVKLRGFRIEPGEIEAVLSEHPAVQEVVVTLRQETGGNRRLVAYLVASQGQQAPTPGEIRGFAKRKLPDYMLPTAFVWLSQLPFTVNGKVDRAALPAPEPEIVEETYVAPWTEVERTIAQIWQEVLHLERVGVHANFFDLGGHSLLLVQVQSRLCESLRKEVSLLEMLKYPTVSALATYLCDGQDALPPFQQIHDRAATRKQLVRQQRRFRYERQIAIEEQRRSKNE